MSNVRLAALVRRIAAAEAERVGLIVRDALARWESTRDAAGQLTRQLAVLEPAKDGSTQHEVHPTMVMARAAIEAEESAKRSAANPVPRSHAVAPAPASAKGPQKWGVWIVGESRWTRWKEDGDYTFDTQARAEENAATHRRMTPVMEYVVKPYAPASAKGAPEQTASERLVAHFLPGDRERIAARSLPLVGPRTRHPCEVGYTRDDVVEKRVAEASPMLAGIIGRVCAILGTRTEPVEDTALRVVAERDQACSRADRSATDLADLREALRSAVEPTEHETPIEATLRVVADNEALRAANAEERAEWSKAMRLLTGNGTYATSEIVPAVEALRARVAVLEREQYAWHAAPVADSALRERAEKAEADLAKMTAEFTEARNDARDASESRRQAHADLAAEREAHERTRAELPYPFMGRVFAVYKAGGAMPDRPLAVFAYGDWAQKWARETWGWFTGWKLDMPDDVEIREVKP